MNLHSELPTNLSKNGLSKDYPVLQESLSTDVVVLGGGISGALMAYHLVNAGIKYLVVDGRAIGQGSTCASTALLQYEIDTPLSQLQHLVGFDNAIRSYIMCGEAINEIENIAKKINYKDFKAVKSLYYAINRKHIRFLTREFHIREAAGFNVKFLSKQEIKKQFGITAPAAILSECAG